MSRVMIALMRRLFPTWTHFAEYLAFLGACVAGIGALPWWAGIILPSILLLLLSWPRWRELAAKARRIDAEWIELGYVTRATNLAFVLTVKFAHDTVHTALAFGFGHFARWFWFG